MDKNSARAVWLVLIVVVANLAFLDWKVLTFAPSEKTVERVVVKETQAEPVKVATGAEEKPEETEVKPVATPAPTAATVAVTTATREVIIPLGSGLTSSLDWADTGAQSYVDTASYSIKEAYFEGSLKSNSGKVMARVKQNNEGTYVPGSEIAALGGASTFISSGKILLSQGNKLYVVQIRSETGQSAQIENARIRLVVR